MSPGSGAALMRQPAPQGRPTHLRHAGTSDPGTGSTSHAVSSTPSGGTHTTPNTMAGRPDRAHRNSPVAPSSSAEIHLSVISCRDARLIRDDPAWSPPRRPGARSSRRTHITGTGRHECVSSDTRRRICATASRGSGDRLVAHGESAEMFGRSSAQPQQDNREHDLHAVELRPDDPRRPRSSHLPCQISVYPPESPVSVTSW